VTGGSGLKLNVPVNAGFRAEPIPAVELFEANNGFDVRDSKFSKALDTFFPSSSEIDIHPASLGHLDSYERASSVSHAGKGWHRDGNKGNGPDEPKVSPVVPTLVPEPGSFPLLLLGLAGIGVLYRRR
jgi:hypothetical protein